MKVIHFSDLHIAVSSYHMCWFRRTLKAQPVREDVDIVIFTGDVFTIEDNELMRGVFTLLKKDVSAIYPNADILYVAGNHEFYNTKTKTETISILRKLTSLVGIVFLDRDIFERGGYTFCGATAWPSLSQVTPAEEFLIKYSIKNGINDFSWIEGWCVDAMIKEGIVDKHFIENTLASKSNVIVCTHIPPSYALRNTRYRDSALIHYFTNFYDDMIAKYSPIAWFYGHNHQSLDRKLFDTHTFSNQRGYIGESLTSFMFNDVIEL